MSITTNLQKIQNEISTNAKIVAISKFHSTDDISEAYKAGHRIFGESRAQEIVPKYEKLPKDIEWHFVGHLQSNKIKDIAPFISLIHSVDSFRLLRNINRHAKNNERVIPCLLQLHIAKEDSKYGFTYDECREMLTKGEWREFTNIQIAGVMGMASFTDDEDKVKSEFIGLKKFYDEIKNDFFAEEPSFKEISMGMSQDYPIAIQEGSTLVRIGSKIFGNRDY